MFVQVIHGTVQDQPGIEADRRRSEELMLTAEGFLSMTGGLTADGRFIMVVLSTSASAAAGRGSSRHDQHEWWHRFSRHLASGATYHESDDITIYRGGHHDGARFVQVMQGRVKDVEAARALNERMEKDMPTQRPDILGGVTAMYDEGYFTDVVYFSSLEDARRNEKLMEENPPPEMQEWIALLQGDLVFFDLEDPWLTTMGG